MLFSNFLSLLPCIVSQKLPATEAHIKMAPPERAAVLQNTKSILDARSAAVLILFYPKDNTPHFVLTHRNTYVGVHSAQISFPGGKTETFDSSFSDTALRETDEEIGIESDKIEIIMPLTSIYIPPSNFLVHPFLGVSLAELKFNPNPFEVQKIIEVSLDHLLDENNIVNTPMRTSYSNNIIVPAFKIEDYLVWGATAMILSELKEIIKKVL